MRLRKLFPLLFLLLTPLRALAQTAPSAPVTVVAPQTALPVNDILRGEWTISLGDGADGLPYEPLIPYAATVSAAYASNLAHNENPVNGVTVNAALTDPAGVLHTYPCWYGEDLAPGTTAATERNPPQPTGFTGWHLAFRPKAAGAWSGHLTVTDAGGTVSGPTFSFTVAGQVSLPDAAKGDLTVSTTDPRYFQYADGDAYLPVGQHFNGGAGGSGYAHLTADLAAHARALLRTWLSLAAGTFGLTGGNSTDQSGGDSSTAHGLTGEAAHSGRFSCKVTYQGGSPAGTGQDTPGAANGTFTYYKPIGANGTPGQTENYGVWVRNMGTATLYAGLTSYANYAPTSALAAVPADGAWHYVTGTIGDATPSGVVNPQIRFEVDSSPGTPNATSQYCLFDDCTIVASGHPLVDAPGSAWDLLGGEGTYETQNILQQPGAAGLDAFLQHCRLSDANLLVEMYQKGDKVQTEIGANGANNSTPVNASGGGCYGGYTSAPTGTGDTGLETAVGLMRSQQARAFVARYGCYQGQGWLLTCFANETDPAVGGVQQWGQQFFANQMRQVAPLDCLPLMGVDNYTPNAANWWYAGEYEDTTYMQFAQPHIPATVANIGGGAWDFGIPYNSVPNDWLMPGITRSATGGPFGQGYVSYAQGVTEGSTGGIALPTFRTAGTYTVTVWVKTLPDSGGAFATTVSGNAFDHNTGLYFAYPSNTNYVSQVTVPAGGCPGWRQLAGNFTLLSSDVPWQGSYGSSSHPAALSFVNNQTHGTVLWGPITITGPNGLFWQGKWDEPRLDAGAGDAVSVWGVPYGTNLSGVASAGFPVLIGESENYNAAPPQTFTWGGNSVTSAMNEYPFAQYALREAASVVDARACTEMNWYEQSQAMDYSGAAAYYHHAQALTDGFGLASGTFGEAVTALSGYIAPGEPLVVYGQENNRSAATGLPQAATKAILSVLPLRPSPATTAGGTLPAHLYLPGSATLDVQGLAAGVYNVASYDLATGDQYPTFVDSCTSEATPPVVTVSAGATAYPGVVIPSGSNQFYNGGGEYVSFNAGNTLTIPFVGTALGLNFGTHGTNLTLSIDGGAAAPFSTATANGGGRYTYTSANVADGSHTAVLTNLGGTVELFNIITYNQPPTPTDLYIKLSGVNSPQILKLTHQ